MASPIVNSEVTSFQQLGIDPQFASISNTAISRDTYLCVREMTATDSNVVIVALQQAPSVTRHKMKADTAVMHPSRNVIALRGNNTLQIFDLGSRARLKSFSLPEGQGVNYWTWVDDDILAFIAGAYVFHWSLSSQSDPTPIFQLQGALPTGNVMSYSISYDHNWMAVFALVNESGATTGKVQLFSRERNASQVIDAFTAAFARVQDFPVLVFCSKSPGCIRINMIPVGNSPNAQMFGKRGIDLPPAPDVPDDMALHLIVSEKYDTVFVLTKFGFLYLVEVETPFVYVSARISNSPFLHAALARDGGIIALTREGRLSKITVNDSTIVDFIVSRRQNPQVAAKIAAAAGLPMSGDFLNQQFDQLLQTGNVVEAARIALQNSGLRNMQTIQKLQHIQQQPGAAPPILQYFNVLIDSTTLNQVESNEICRIVISQNRPQFIEKWIKEEKLTMTEELGDICKQCDTRIALAIYIRAQAHAKVVAAFAETGTFDKLQQYCQRFQYNPDWMQILTICVRSGKPDSLEVLLRYLANGGQPIADPRSVVQILMQFNFSNPALLFLLEVIPNNREEDSELQTTLFEIALNNNPKMGEELFCRETYTFYDRQRVAALCERAGNFQRALEHYEDLPSIKRCIVNTQAISVDFLVNYIGQLQNEWALQCLRELLLNNARANVQIVVQVAGQNWQKFGIDSLISLFNETHSSEGIYYFLAQVVSTCEDPDIHFRYIEAAVKLQNYQEVERMCNDSQHLQAERVRDFLMCEDLSDAVPLIVLCNRFGFIEDLTKFLYKKNRLRELETYCQKFNSAMAGRVIGALIDIEAPPDYISRLINSVQHTAPIEDLIRETMKRERLKLLEPILIQRAQAGSIDQATNNGIVLLAVLSNRNPEKILNDNQYYDPKFVGDILAKRDAHLACLAYAHGRCDQDIISLTNQHELYKEQARYLVDRESPELWAMVLSPDNENMKSVVDAVTSTALPECDNPEKVSSTVQAFIEAQIPTQLLGLLEKVVLENPQFMNNVSLQNMLIITAIKSDTSRVMTYVTRLSDYTWDKICDVLVSSQLFDEAIAAFKKFDQHVLAVQVMLNNKQNIPEAVDWAQHCNDSTVWSEVAHAQLEAGQVVEAIDSFIKAKDPREFHQVITIAETQSQYRALVKYLTLARQIANRDPIIETELCFSYAKCDMLAELEELVSSPNSAKVHDIGDRCFKQELYKAAKILYTAVKDYTRLCQTLLMLKEFQLAIEAARKASTTSAWKAVNRACVESGEFKLAQQAGLQIVIEADQLNDVIALYEYGGHFTQIIQLLEASLTLDRAHGGIFVELAILYAKHQPEKCLEHLTQYYGRMALFKVIKILLKMHMWKELAFAYEKYSEVDNAVLTMMEHPSLAWNHNKFKELIGQISSPDILYRSLNFYLTFDPKNLNDILNTIGTKLDATRVVDIFTRNGNLQLIKSWLSSIQPSNIKAVNEALNRLYIEDGDYETLRHSIDAFDLFEHISLARSLEKHMCLEFRRISSYLYRQSKRWDEAIDLSKKDKLYKDCIETAASSRSIEVVEDLLRFFVESKLFECFAAATFVCFDLVTSDLVLELAWRNKCTDFAMPFLIQSMRDQNQTIKNLQADLVDLNMKVAESKQAAAVVAAVSANSQTGFAPTSVSMTSDPFQSTGAPPPPAADGFGAFPPTEAFSTGGGFTSPAATTFGTGFNAPMSAGFMPAPSPVDPFATGGTTPPPVSGFQSNPFL